MRPLLEGEQSAFQRKFWKWGWLSVQIKAPPTANHSSFDFRALPLPSPVIVLDKFSRWNVTSIVLAAQLPFHARRWFRSSTSGVLSRDLATMKTRTQISSCVHSSLSLLNTMQYTAMSYHLGLQLQRARTSLAQTQAFGGRHGRI